MAGKISQFLCADHARLDDALRRATADATRIDHTAYAEFREGLLRHIGMEEKILFPAARSARSGKRIRATAKLSLDHGALAALLVLTPTHSIIAAIRAILNRHNPLEERAGGVYEKCEQALGAEADQIAARLQNTPPVKVKRYNDSVIALESARNALGRAGYELDF